MALAEVGRTETEGYVLWLLGRVADSTVNQRCRSLQEFSVGFEEGGISVNPFDRMRPPKIEQKEVPVISVEDIQALLKACEGSGLTTAATKVC